MTLPSLRFDNRFVDELPGDPVAENARRQVRGACYSRVRPTQMPAPKMLAYSREVAALLDLDEAALASKGLLDVLAGNAMLDGMKPYAACYGGHQFGNWAGQLGDGRAITLGEVVNGRGERWELQLKGAGPTPYSRSGDGRAVLRSSVREFLCSEAMHHLGVPTTRALSLVTTGEAVVRDMLYDGNPAPEPGAIVCRVSPSFIRFGNFQIFASRGETDVLRRLLDLTIARDFPELGAPSPETYLAFLEEVARRTALMVVHWMRVGFVHGVMNTDNMSVLGLTIDYGPYGWLDDYDPGWTPNTTDAQGRRYRYGNQPPIAFWNVVQLANALASLDLPVKRLEEALEVFVRTFEAAQAEMIAAKFGFSALGSDDEPLVDALFEALTTVETDMTIFYRRLGQLPSQGELDPAALLAHFRDAHYAPDDISAAEGASIALTLGRYRERVRRDGRPDAERRARMEAVNPLYVLRNYLAQQAIDAAEGGDPSEISELLEVMRNPYEAQPGRARFAEKRPDWARSRPGCSMLSCSS